MVALFGPIPKPNRILKPTIIFQFLEKACARQERIENMQARKMVPRRPRILFSGWVSLYCRSDLVTSRFGMYTPTTEYTTEIGGAGDDPYTVLVF